MAQKEQHDSIEETIFNKKRFNPSILEISYSFSDLKTQMLIRRVGKGGFPLWGFTLTRVNGISPLIFHRNNPQRITTKRRRIPWWLILATLVNIPSYMSLLGIFQSFRVEQLNLEFSQCSTLVPIPLFGLISVFLDPAFQNSTIHKW